MGSRVMSITHKGSTAVVKESFDNKCVIEFNKHRQITDKKFPAACREALTYLLKHGGEMRGDYSR